MRQLRARNPKVLYRSMKRMGPDAAPAQRLRKVGTSNVLVDCFMHILAGSISEEGRRSAVSRSLRWNTGRESQKLK